VCFCFLWTFIFGVVCGWLLWGGGSFRFGVAGPVGFGGLGFAGCFGFAVMNNGACIFLTA
jgi:hypothetical protein